MFQDGSYPFWRAECTPDKKWNPTEAQECVREYPADTVERESMAAKR